MRAGLGTVFRGMANTDTARPMPHENEGFGPNTVHGYAAARYP